MLVIEELVPDGLWERIAPLLPPPKNSFQNDGQLAIADQGAGQLK